MILGHLARIGGVIVRPRRTLSAVLFDRRGRLWEVVLWMIVVCAAAQPVRAGQAMLLSRVDIIGGASAFLNLLASRMLGPLIGALVGAAILWAIDRKNVSFDAAVDTCAFALVPLLLLTAVGAGLSNLGVELWFLPHRTLGGRGVFFGTRLAVGYGWSILLFLLLVLEVRKRGDATPAPADRPAA